MRNYNILFLLTAAFLFTPLVSCTDEESALGIDLVDSTTMYDGQQYVLYADDAWTEVEDSLLTSNYSYGAIGNYHDATFGKVKSILYTQIALPSNTADFSFDSDMILDSVVLSLATTGIFPDTNRSYRFHFEVMRLAEPVLSDTTYYAWQSLPVDNSGKYFDATVRMSGLDTVVSLKLDTNVYSLLRRTATAEEFIQQTKGLRIRLKESSDEGVLGIDFSSVQTCLRAHYHYIHDNDTTTGFYTFLMGAGTAHFTQFIHDYSGTIFTSKKIPGAYRLYLEPMGGQRVRLSFDRDLQAFHAAHPWAVIHQAELLMTVAPEDDGRMPDQILTLGKDVDGNDAYINDLLDVYTLKGYDGTYNADKNYYRMRVTQHLQSLLRQGSDRGWLLLLNSRRHSPMRAILYGTEVGDANKRPRIVLTYSE